MRNAKTAKCSGTSDLGGLNKSPKLKDEQHLRRNSRVAFDTAMNDFNPGQFKIQMKKMAALINFHLFLNALMPSELFGT